MTDKRVCRICLKEDNIYNSLKNIYGKMAKCSYCNNLKKTIPVTTVAEEIEKGISFEYKEAGMEYFSPETDTYTIPVKKTEDILYFEYDNNNAKFCNDICECIDPQDDRHWYNWDERYLEDLHINDEWKTFCDIVKYETRYVFFIQPNEGRYNKISKIFDFIAKAIDKLNLRKEVSSDHEFFRGRMHTIDENLANESALAAPSREYAQMNRMSAEGISLFYGANDVKTVIAEIYDPNYNFVTVTGFTNKDPLFLLDLRSNQIKPPSLFDKKNRSNRSYIRFLKNFVTEITKSIDKSSEIDYIPTQILTEYFRYIDQHGCYLDGIAYSSSKNPKGICYALFFNHNECIKTKKQKLFINKDSLQTYQVSKGKSGKIIRKAIKV